VGSDLAEQLLKDPYQFDFLTLASSAKEREVAATPGFPSVWLTKLLNASRFS